MRIIVKKGITILLIVCGILLIVAAVSLIAVNVLFSYTNVPLSELHWNQPPSVIALSPMKRNEKEGMLLVRIRDGKEEFFPGDWETNFSETGNVFVFQQSDASASSENKQTVYYVQGGEKIQIITLAKLAGRILSIQENPSSTYLLISMFTGKSMQYCVAERVGEKGYECKQLGVPGVSNGIWNPEKEHEVIIQTRVGDIVRYDPWKKKPESIFQGSQEYPKLAAYFTNDKNPQTIDSGESRRTYFRLFNVLLVKNEKNWSLYRIPVISDISWLADSGHLLVKDTSGLSIIELNGKKQVYILLGDKLSGVRVKTRYGKYTSTLSTGTPF